MEVLHEIVTWFLLFIIYAFLGWLMEMLSTIFYHHKFYNRGFLIGPLCPIYGVAGVLITFIVGEQENILEIFCVVMLLGGVIEYFTSYIMEKLFHARWWDYSNRPFNINGRVFLGNLLAFGALGVLVVKFLSPFFLGLLARINNATLYSIAIVVAVILLCDFIISLNLIIRFRNTTKVVRGDATEEITEYIRSVFSQNGRLNRRLLKAFPAMTVQKSATGKKSPKKRR